MIKTIKKLAVIVFVSILFFSSSCSEDEGLTGDRATITGPDLRECVLCCGGWFINIEGDQYRFTEVPFSREIDLENATFPVEVAVIWSIREDRCNGEEITLTSLLRVE